MRYLLPLALLATGVVTQQPQVTTIRAGLLLDGRGGVRRNVVVTLRAGRIARLVPAGGFTGRVTHDLSRFTLLPGFIDTHVHIDSHFGPDGRASTQGETPAQRQYAAADNAYRTLMAGFTTVQS